MADALIPVGNYTEEFNTLTGQQLPCGVIYQSPGLIAHVQKRHPNEVGSVQHVADVIRSPDYIGKHPKEQNSIELIKRMNDNVMVCVKLDSANGYFYVASVFHISDAKLNNRLNSGRIKRYSV